MDDAFDRDLHQLIESRPRDEFPFGSSPELDDLEMALLSAFESMRGEPLSSRVRRELSIPEAYMLATLAVRAAVRGCALGVCATEGHSTRHVSFGPGSPGQASPNRADSPAFARTNPGQNSRTWIPHLLWRRLLGDPELLRRGLLGLVLDDEQLDSRDVLCALSVVHDCAKRLGLDLADELASCRDFATDGRWSTIVGGFLRREEAMKSLACFGIDVEATPDGPRYRHR